MKIAFGCDHAAFDIKKQIIDFLGSRGHALKDFGCFSNASCDYPDIAVLVARSVAGGESDRGILVCGTGIGMSIAANKVPGIRAATCWSDEVAKLAGEHNAANILCLGARCAPPGQMQQWIAAWLATPPSSEPRHVQRIEKITAIEKDASRRRK
jgi:RpiB/LacA/LacB family sugar-phosphate isomerase